MNSYRFKTHEVHGIFFALAGDGGGAGLVSINQFMSFTISLLYLFRKCIGPLAYININYFEKLMKFNVKKKPKLYFERVLPRSFPDNDA